jgi:hypothetical protein
VGGSTVSRAVVRRQAAPRTLKSITNMNMNKSFWLAALAFATTVTTAFAQVPGIIQYQGRVTSHGTNFTGTGQFKFAIIETVITGQAVWNNAGVMDIYGEPSSSVSVPVNNGLFIVGLGDTSLANMMTIPASIFAYENLKLRIWFSDGVGAFAALSPDQKITSVGFAMMAADVANGAITASKLAPDAVTGDKLASNSVAGIHLLNQSITGAKIVPNSITSTQIADTLTLQQLDLGGPSWNGVLNLWAAGANESRGFLTGDGSGSLLNLKFVNNSTGVVLSARSPGAKLNLWDGLGLETTRLGAGLGGGELTLLQLNGQVGIFMDGDKTTYGNPTSTGAEIEVRNGSGDLGVLIDGHGTGSAGEIRLLNTASNTTTVQILAAESTSSGAEMRLRRANGTTTIALDAENDGAGNPRVDLFTGGGTNTMAFLPGGGDAALSGGGLIRLGLLNGNNLGIDDNEIIARNNGVSSPLMLNYGYTGVVHMTRVAINTVTPAAGYSVSVNGKVICEELVVQDSGDWPDYVFAGDYALMSLEEVEASIQRNKHLPGIASAKKIGEEGIPLGQLQKQMMEKIEELTLHLIQQNKRLQAQEEELGKLRARFDVVK